MLLGFLLVLLVLVCVALSTVILLQRSEGGALGMGGGPSWFMSARGAGDLLTRTTAVLATVFFLLCLLLTVLSGRMHNGGSIVDRLKVQDLNPATLNQAAHAPGPQAPGAASPAAPVPGPNTAIFAAPPPEVHTAPASPAAPATSAGNAHGHVSSIAGVQTAPRSAPTFAPLAKPGKPASELNIPSAPAPSMNLTPPPAAPAGNSTGGA